MTATSDERREVAWRLRSEVSEGECIDYAVCRIINDTLGVNGAWGDKAARILADLIDPTCHIKDDDWASHQCMGPMLSCDRCGNAFPEINGPYQYCPCCGARVTRDGDE
jgi:hypothetical protein